MAREEKEAKRRPLYSWVLIILIFILSIAALISGAMLFLSPNGDWLAMSTDVLADSPFPDYLVPGLILFLFIGVFPFIVGLGLVNLSFKWLRVINPFRQHYWAWSGVVGTGIILLIWIITETALIGYVSILQPVMGAWGALLLCLALLPPVRQYYRLANQA